MSRALGSLLSLLSLPGCLVSFNDYPLGELEATSQAGGKVNGGQSGGGAAAVGGSGEGVGNGAALEGGAPDGGDSGITPTSSRQVIDDFEDGNQDLPALAGRSGSWYAVNDGRGVQTPASNGALLPTALTPAREASGRAAHTFGGPFQTWGALIGTTLATSQGMRVPYDVSAYQGLRLWVRSESLGPSAARSVRLNLPTPVTTSDAACSVCNDHFGASIPLTSEWQRVEIEFSELAQTGFGVPRAGALDLTSVLAVELLFPRGVSFDLWIDDIELF